MARRPLVSTSWGEENAIHEGRMLSVALPTPSHRKAGARAPLRSDAHPCAPALQINAPIICVQQTVATLGRPAALDFPTGALDREWESTSKE